MKKPVYLDYHSTTPMDPEVLEAMIPYFTERFGNPSSRSHEYGWTAEAAVEKARVQVARLIGATEKDIVFTSGATESNNLAIQGVAEAYAAKGRHLITTAVEHRAVLDVFKHLGDRGFQITVLPVDSSGQLSPEALRSAITAQTTLVSVILANNEVGTINRVAELGKLCREMGVIFHTDAVQAAGRMSIDVNAMNIDLLSLSAHKLYGPKGVGALYVRRRQPRVTLAPQLHGGTHERGLRPGTLNVPGIVGFGKAAEMAHAKLASDCERAAALRDRLWSGLQSRIPEISRNGHATDRLCNNLNVTFSYVEASSLMTSLKDIAISSGAACSSEEAEPSHVLLAIGLTEEQARSSIRFGLGRFTTEEEIDFAVGRIAETVQALRESSPVYRMDHDLIFGAENAMSKDPME